MCEKTDYQISLEICPTPLLLVGSQGDIVRTNRRLDQLFGYESGELAGQKVEVLVPQNIRHSHPDLRDAFFEAPTSRPMGMGRDLRGVRKNGEMIPVEVGLEPIEFDEQSMVMVSVVDIRERKNNEAMIRRALDAASSAMIQVNDRGEIELVNEQAVRLFGYESPELLGMPIEMLIPDRARRKHCVYRASYQINQGRRAMGADRELYALRKDGTEFAVEIGLTPVEQPSGKSTMATIIDITDRQRIEKHIREQNEQLVRLNTELLEFAYSASHDLKGPLSSIAGLLAFCQQDLDAGDLDEAKANVSKTRKLAERLASRVEDVLALAKSDMQTGVWEEVAFRPLLEDSWALVSASESASAIQFTDSLKHVGLVCCIPSSLAVILQNLLSNAVKYQEPDQPSQTVHVETWTEDRNFCVAVEDNGVGIPPSHQDKVFRLFYRLAGKDIPGTGLGLPLVKKQVTRLGGTVELTSGNGKTRFTLKLPQKAIPTPIHEE